MLLEWREIFLTLFLYYDRYLVNFVYELVLKMFIIALAWRLEHSISEQSSNSLGSLAYWITKSLVQCLVSSKCIDGSLLPLGNVPLIPPPPIGDQFYFLFYKNKMKMFMYRKCEPAPLKGKTGLI